MFSFWILITFCTYRCVTRSFEEIILSELKCTFTEPSKIIYDAYASGEKVCSFIKPGTSKPMFCAAVLMCIPGCLAKNVVTICLLQPSTTFNVSFISSANLWTPTDNRLRPLILLSQLLWSLPTGRLRRQLHTNTLHILQFIILLITAGLAEALSREGWRNWLKE